MSAMEFWTILILLTVFAGLLGYAIGRRHSPGGSHEIQQQAAVYEQQLAQKQLELERYQQTVHEHYNQTAGLFKNMAGSYKDLFDHLSSGYEQLGQYPENRILPERAGALLDGADKPKSNDFMNPADRDEDALTR